jgi:hypothetical protein
VKKFQFRFHTGHKKMDDGLWTAMGGFFAGVFSKVAADYLSREIAKPEIEIKFRPQENFVVRTVTGNGISCFFVRIRVTNSGRRSANNCRGHLVCIERRQPNGDFQTVPGGDDPLALIWAVSDPQNPEYSFDLSPGVGRYMDVLSYWPAQQGDGMGQGIENVGAISINGRLRLETGNRPNTLSEFGQTNGQFRLTIQLSADDAVPTVIKLDLDWRGLFESPRLETSIES